MVEDDMTLVGMLSEQNVMRLFHTYNDEKNRTVNDFMTQPAIALAPYYQNSVHLSRITWEIRAFVSPATGLLEESVSCCGSTL